MKLTELESFTIIDGTLVDPDYPHEFHTFFEDKILKLQLLLPGIIPESLQVRTKAKRFDLRVHIKSDYHQIFKAKILVLRGELAEEVLENVLVANYDDGILTLELARASQIEDN